MMSRHYTISFFFGLLLACSTVSGLDCGVYAVNDELSYERASQNCTTFSSLTVTWQRETPGDLVFGSVVSVSNTLSITKNKNVTSVSFPSLTQVGLTLSVSSNDDLQSVVLPFARSNGASVTVNNNVGFVYFEAPIGSATFVQLTNNQGTNQVFNLTDLNSVSGATAFTTNDAVALYISNMTQFGTFSVNNNANLTQLHLTALPSTNGFSATSFELSLSPLSEDVEIELLSTVTLSVHEVGSAALSFTNLVSLGGSLNVYQCSSLSSITFPLLGTGDDNNLLNSGFSVRDLPNLTLFEINGRFQTTNGIEVLRVGSQSQLARISLGLVASTYGSLTVSNSFISSLYLPSLARVNRNLIFQNNYVSGVISITGIVDVYGRVSFVNNTIGTAIYATGLRTLSEELVVSANQAVNATSGFLINLNGLSKVFTFANFIQNVGVSSILLNNLNLVGGYFDRPTRNANQTDLTFLFNQFTSGASISSTRQSTVFGRFIFQNNTNDGTLQVTFNFVQVGDEIIVSFNDFSSMNLNSLDCAYKITFSDNSGGLASLNSLAHLNYSLITNDNNKNNISVGGKTNSRSSTSCVACNNAIGCSDDNRFQAWFSACPSTPSCPSTLNAKNSPPPPTQANAPLSLPTFTGPDSATDSPNPEPNDSEQPSNSQNVSTTAVPKTTTKSNIVGSASSMVASIVLMGTSMLFLL